MYVTAATSAVDVLQLIFATQKAPCKFSLLCQFSNFVSNFVFRFHTLIKLSQISLRFSCVLEQSLSYATKFLINLLDVSFFHFISYDAIYNNIFLGSKTINKAVGQF